MNRGIDLPLMGDSMSPTSRDLYRGASSTAVVDYTESFSSGALFHFGGFVGSGARIYAAYNSLETNSTAHDGSVIEVKLVSFHGVTAKATAGSTH